MQDIIYTTLAKIIRVKTDKLNLFVPSFLPDPETQKTINDYIKKSFTSSFEEWVTDRRVVNTELEYQVDIGSSHKINSPKYAILAHQTSARSEKVNKTNVAIFDKNDVRNYFCDNDGIRYPKDGVIINDDENIYLDQ